MAAKKRSKEESSWSFTNEPTCHQLLWVSPQKQQQTIKKSAGAQQTTQNK